MALGVGKRISFPDGRSGEIVWAGGNYDCREYKIRIGRNISHYTHDELLNQLFQRGDQGVYKFDMTLDTHRR